MTERLKTPCELGNCNYFHLERLDDSTREFIFQHCQEDREAMSRYDPEFGSDQCPYATVTSAVIMKTESIDGLDSLNGEL